MDDRIDWRIVEDQPPLPREDEPLALYTFSITKVSSHCLKIEASSKEDAYEQVRAMDLDILPSASDDYIEINLDSIDKL